MSSKLRIALEPTPHDKQAKVLGEGLDAYNREHAGDYGDSEFVIGLRDDTGALIGGVLADVYWGAMFLKYVWLDKSVRRQGIGSKLIRAVEDEGRKRGCTMAHLDTFSFQARGFYEKLGYAVFGTLEWNGRDIQRHYLSKKL
jgi:GNAT superfamily N-acetyltransferase